MKNIGSVDASGQKDVNTVMTFDAGNIAGSAEKIAAIDWTPNSLD